MSGLVNEEIIDKSEGTSNNEELRMVARGCEVRLRFRGDSQDSALSDIKKMMLAGYLSADAK